MALSDSASSSIPKKRQNSMFMMVRSYLAKYIRNTLLSRKQTFKQAYDTNGSPRHLNIVSDFHTCSFRFFTSLNNHLKWLLNILCHVPNSYLVISSQIKHWFFLYFVNVDRHFFPKIAHLVGKIEINTVIVSQTCYYYWS